MKPYLYLFVLFFTAFYSCQSPEKLVEQQKYERVLKRAEPIFNRKKMPALKWVKAVESSLKLANQKDLLMIQELEYIDRLSSWKKIYYTLLKMDRRQRKIKQYPQYTAETGYTPTLVFHDTQPKKEEVRSRIAQIYLIAVNQKMVSVRNGSKRAALTSIRLLDSALVWKKDIPNAQILREEAIDSAIVRVALYVHSTERYTTIAYDIESLLRRDFSRYFKPYLVVKVDPEPDFNSDYYFFVEPVNYYVGSGHESSSSRTYSKEVVTGHKEEKKWNTVDSVWVTKTVEIKEKVYATVVKHEQQKEAWMNAYFSLEDAQTRQVYYEKKIGTRDCFSNDYSEAHGDRRAFPAFACSGSRSSFPSNGSMISRMSNSMARQACRFIKKRNWWAD